ncbi:MAG: nucleotide exchange factor GrpE [Candidatus Zixiibacteriota bacterium]
MANHNINTQLLDVIDNFERALEAVGKTDDKEALKKGAEMIYQQLLEILKKENVVHIIAIGEPFDPNFHEAMMQAESDEYPEGIVISEMVKGYKLKDKVIRYSKVVVSNGQSNSEESDED